MMRNPVFAALIPAVIFILLALPVAGIDLLNENLRLEVSSAPIGDWIMILSAALVIFLSQLFRRPLDAGVASFKAAMPKVEVKHLLADAKIQRLLIIFLILALFLWPFFYESRSGLDISIKVLIYVMLGLGLNVVVGLAGLLDLGYVGFYAVGAYTYALLNHYFGLGFWISLPIAGAFAALAGFLLGFPVLRLRGDYLAIVTLGFGEIIRILLNNLTSITGGPNGITGIDRPTLFGLEFNRKLKEGGFDTFHNFFGIDYDPIYRMIFIYLLALILVLICVYVINRLQRMPIGRAWEALREDEIACRSLGLNRTVIKLSAFTIGATTAGFAGSFFAAYQGTISPESFVFIESAIILAIVVLGGMGSQLGVILAAIVLTVLPEVAREFSQYRMLMFGGLMVLMMIWRPQGFMPMTRPRIELNTNESQKEGV